MPAQVAMSPSVMPISNSAGAGAALSPSGSPAGASPFGSLLSLLSIGLQGQNGTCAANTDNQFQMLGNSAIGSDTAVLVLPQELSGISKDDLMSLLSSMMASEGATLNSDTLASLTPGTPSKEVLQSLKDKLMQMGIDASKLSLLTAQITDANQLEKDNAAAQILLIATGLKPSDLEAVKAAIKSAADNADLVTANTAESQALSDQKTVDANEASAAAILMVFVAPQQSVETPNASDMSFDLSAMSAFTQSDAISKNDTDWAQKLSNKLSNLTPDTSPFDEEMNAILSLATGKPAKSDAGFQGSLATLNVDKKNADDSATSMSGTMTAQAANALGTSGSFNTSSLQHFDTHSLLGINGALTSGQSSSNLTNPVLNATSAASAHPSVQAIATMIEKAASGSDKAKKELSVELDPPELGRVQIQLSMEKDGPLKVHLLTEKQDTFNLLQRDSHALKAALESAGIQTDNASLSFDFSGNSNQSFNQLMGGSQDNNSGGQQTRFTIGSDGSIQNTSALPALETRLDFTPDSVTGNVHYSLLV